MLDPSGPLPLYQQLKAVLRRSVEVGTWAPHQAIPPERELIAQFGVSRITVRQALADLQAEGVLYRRHGKGTFVAPPRTGPIAAGLSELTGHVEELQVRGLSPEVELLRLTREPLPPATALALSRPDGAEAWRIIRLVRVSGLPVMVAEAWVPTDLGVPFHSVNLKDQAVARILEEFGQVPARGLQRISASRATPAEARLLGAQLKDPLLEVTRTIRGLNDRPLEWSRAVYRPDRYHYEVELRRKV